VGQVFPDTRGQKLDGFYPVFQVVPVYAQFYQPVHWVHEGDVWRYIARGASRTSLHVVIWQSEGAVQELAL
jgi:hypothetical protein